MKLSKKLVLPVLAMSLISLPALAGKNYTSNSPYHLTEMEKAIMGASEIMVYGIVLYSLIKISYLYDRMYPLHPKN